MRFLRQHHPSRWWQNQDAPRSPELCCCFLLGEEEAQEGRECNNYTQGRFLPVSLSQTGISSPLEKNIFNFLGALLRKFSEDRQRCHCGPALYPHFLAPRLSHRRHGPCPKFGLFQLLLEQEEAGREKEMDSKSLGHQ